MKIVVLNGKSAGTEHRLDDHEVFVIGSGSEAQLRLEDAGVLPNHVRIFRDENRFILMDVTGAGVLVNGRAQVQAELRAGDELGVGEAVLRVTPAGVPLSAVLQRPPSSIALGAGAELRVLKGPDEGKTFPLPERATLGRGVNADVALLDMKCSREHCAVEKRAEGWVLVDLGSTNGTRLNEVKLETKGIQLLRHGDKLRLGGTLVEFRSGNAAVARPGLPSVLKAPEPRKDKVFEIDLDSLSSSGDRPAPTPEEIKTRAAQTMKVRPSALYKRMTGKETVSLEESGEAATLEGDLEKMGFAQVVQFLNLQRKTGELLVFGPSSELGVAFVDGEVRDAWGVPGALTAEHHFFGIARLRRGFFQFNENTQRRETRIAQPTLALLMEAMRLVDESTDTGE